MSEAEKPELDLNSLSKLMELARDGDSSARSEICRKVQGHLMGRAERDLDQRLRGKLNPSDIVQQTMTRMIVGFKDFRGSTSKEFYGWLNTILRNELNSTRRDWYRERRDVRREHIAADDEQTAFVPDGCQPAVTELVQQKEQLARFRQVIGRLPQDYAQVIQLRGLEDLPFTEVARVMSRSVDSVSKLWMRALVKLTEELENLDESIS